MPYIDARLIDIKIEWNIRVRKPAFRHAGSLSLKFLLANSV